MFILSEIIYIPFHLSVVNDMFGGEKDMVCNPKTYEFWFFVNLGGRIRIVFFIKIMC